MIFNIYDNEKRTLEIVTETPYLCQKNFYEENSKCNKFYNAIISNTSDQRVFVCPYGLCAIRTKTTIYTCLNITEKTDLTKLIPNLRRYNQSIKQFTQYSLSQVIRIIDEFEKTNYETQVRRLTIHDIKNATKHFIDLVEEVKNDEEVNQIAEANDKLFSSVEGYSLIQYRLAYHDKLLNYEENTVEKAYINFHQMMKKLSKLLMYRGIKKGVLIDLHACSTIPNFRANKDLYLMYYILMENALKFALEKTTVKINCLITEENELRIEISNTCYQIEDEEIDKIFLSGYRSKSAMNTSKGSGLGLTLVKKIADVSNVQLDCKYKSVTKETGEFIIKCVHKRNHE